MGLGMPVSGQHPTIRFRRRHAAAPRAQPETGRLSRLPPADFRNPAAEGAGQLEIRHRNQRRAGSRLRPRGHVCPRTPQLGSEIFGSIQGTFGFFSYSASAAAAAGGPRNSHLRRQVPLPPLLALRAGSLPRAPALDRGFPAIRPIQRSRLPPPVPAHRPVRRPRRPQRPR